LHTPANTVEEEEVTKKCSIFEIKVIIKWFIEIIMPNSYIVIVNIHNNKYL